MLSARAIPFLFKLPDQHPQEEHPQEEHSQEETFNSCGSVNNKLPHRMVSTASGNRIPA
jgi:hypothetical protein